jgi:hypothetical protein
MDVSNYLLPGIGMKPPYLGITSPPRELLASVVPAVSLNKSHRLDKVNITIKVGEEFLVAHGVERIKATKWIDSLGFLHHTRLDHQLDALINSLIELLTISGEPNLDNTEGTSFLLPCMERGEGAPCSKTHLIAMEHTLVVLRINRLIIDRIQETQLRKDSVKPFRGIALPDS